MLKFVNKEVLVEADTANRFYWVDLTNKIILITEQVDTGTAAKDIIKSNNLPSNKGCKNFFHLFPRNMYLT